MRDEEGRSISTSEGEAAWTEAISYLQTVEPRSALSWSDGLAASAFDHCTDVGSKGIANHVGSDGSGPFERISRYGKASGMEGENISFGSKIAQSIIMDLFVDDGVSSREHRDSLMQSDFKFTGIAFCPHKGKYKYMTDFLYAGSYDLNAHG